MSSSSDLDATGDALHAAAALHADEQHDRLEAAATLAEAATEESELPVLITAREHLRMDVAYLSHSSGTEQIVQRLHGDARSFGLKPGMKAAFANAHVQGVLDGRLRSVMADVPNDPRASDVDPALGAYVCVPVRFSDARLYGALCCISHGAAPWLGDHDLAFMRVLGRILADELERDETQREAKRREDEAIALSALLAALDARDSYTSRHSEAVVALSIDVTRELGMPESFVDEVRQVALLHDIGKIGIPDAILGKRGPLNDAEWELMHTHPVIGARIVESVAALAQHAPAIRAEHERCDGSGYPDGLTRKQIPLASRITFACDAYDAMMSSRPYRPIGMHSAAAAAELRDKAGTQFDPDVVAALLRVVQR
jgi:hypothetical protein